jgi:hypothetical protein
MPHTIGIRAALCQHAHSKVARMSDTSAQTGTMHFESREVVGVFSDPETMDRAVTQLGVAGFAHAAISVLGLDKDGSFNVAPMSGSSRDIADNPAAPQGTYISEGTRNEGEAVAVGVPLTIGGFAGAWAVAAAGGALIAAIGATVVGGVVGAGLGALLFRAVAYKRAENIETQLAKGGMVLWVTTPDAAAEERATEVLTRCGAKDVHSHTIAREWGVDDAPLHNFQPDPFLAAER